MASFAFGAFRLDTATRELLKDGRPVAMPPRAFACLVHLVEHRARAVGRDELIDAMWEGRPASDVQLAQLILQCRRAVDDDGQTQRAIRTIAGFGYRWVEPVHEVAEGSRRVDRAESSSAASDAHPDRASASASAPKPRRRLALAAVLVALAVGAIFVARFVAERNRAPQPAASGARGTTLVMPIHVEDAAARWLRLGGMDVIVQRLRQDRVPVLSSEATVALLESGDGDAGDPTTLGLPARARADAGADIIVAVAASRADALWHVRATIDRGTGTPIDAQASDADPLAALRVLSDRVAGALGYSASEPGTGAGTGEAALTLQQARAAMLANDVDRARELLESNPALAANEPLLREQLIEVDLRAGRYAEARRKIDAMLGEDIRDAGLRADLLNQRGTVAIRTGHFAEAGRYFSAAIAAMGTDAESNPVRAGRAWLGRGISRTSLQDYAGAQSDYARARDLFEKAGDLGSTARVDTDVGALETLRGHMAQAESYLERALERFRAFGMLQEQVNALQLLFVARRGQLDNAEAAATIDRAWAMRARIVSPSSILSTGLYRVESLLVAGRLDEAAAQLDAIDGPGHAAAGSEADRRLLMRATLEREQGRLDAALATLAPASEAVDASADDDTVHANVALLRARLQRMLHRADDAKTAPTDNALLTPTPRTPIRKLAEANRAWARDDVAAADAAFAAALKIADEQAVAETIAAVVTDDVEYLVEHGRIDEARAVAARVALWADADFDCALAGLRVARAAHDRAAWTAALERTRRLAGQRRLPAGLDRAWN